jgi:hypothetical protein
LFIKHICFVLCIIHKLLYLFQNIKLTLINIVNIQRTLPLIGIHFKSAVIAVQINAKEIVDDEVHEWSTQVGCVQGRRPSVISFELKPVILFVFLIFG